MSGGLLAVLLAAAGTAVQAYPGYDATHDQAHGAWIHPKAVHDFTHPPVAAKQPPRLGVAIAAVSPDELDAAALEYGVRVQRVLTGSAADRAGMEPGDIVTDIAGRPAYSPERLLRLVGEASGRVSVALVRDGERLRLQAELGAQPAGETGRAYLGVRIQEMTDDLKEAFGAEGNLGVLVSQVMDGSAAQQAGLKAGDVVVRIGDTEIASTGDLHAAIDARAPGDALALSILRDREARSVDVALGERAGSAASVVGKGHGWHHGRGLGHHPHGTMSKKHCDWHRGFRRS